MRLLLASMTVLIACSSSGHGGAPPAGAGGGPGHGAGLSADAGDALAIADASDALDAVDAAPTFSCLVAADGDGPAACIELDPGDTDASGPCAANGAGPIAIGACPRDTSAGGCHVAETGTAGYTVWWYAPLGAGAVLSRCERMGDSYVSP